MGTSTRIFDAFAGRSSFRSFGSGRIFGSGTGNKALSLGHEENRDTAESESSFYNRSIDFESSTNSMTTTTPQHEPVSSMEEDKATEGTTTTNGGGRLWSMFGRNDTNNAAVASPSSS